MPDRDHTCAKHQPGEPCYCHCGCRCTGCLTDRTRRQKRRKHLGGGTVPASSAHAHLTRLLRRTTLSEISRATGISRASLRRLVDGDVTRIYRTTEAAVLSVRNITPTSTIGTRRRLEALCAIGWSLAEISRHAGMSDSWAAMILRSIRTTPDVAAKIRAIYDQLWNQQPPTDTWGDRINRGRAKARAARRGYAPPLAWDDDTIDEAHAQPFGHNPSTQPKRRTATIIEAIDDGAPLADLTRRFGIKPDSIYSVLKRAGRADLWDRISPRMDRNQPETRAA
ncbi:hypothetical protein [Micropruina sp.]|uniref:hypothetical protein n=1 Tax=Micropruina sp. TaxID=2737536 RepID=UPI0039E22620